MKCLRAHAVLRLYLYFYFTVFQNLIDVEEEDATSNERLDKGTSIVLETLTGAIRTRSKKFFVLY